LGNLKKTYSLEGKTISKWNFKEIIGGCGMD
jgi:hypothetical protein